jgi:hypothetical protein
VTEELEELIAFLTDCMDEDERIAQAVIAQQHRDLVIDMLATGSLGVHRHALHVAHWDPARVLVQVAASRRILGAWRRQREEDDPAVFLAGDTIPLAMAQPYAGWHGWREEWRA